MVLEVILSLQRGHAQPQALRVGFTWSPRGTSVLVVEGEGEGGRQAGGAGGCGFGSDGGSSGS